MDLRHHHHRPIWLLAGARPGGEQAAVAAARQQPQGPPRHLRRSGRQHLARRRQLDAVTHHATTGITQKSRFGNCIPPSCIPYTTYWWDGYDDGAIDGLRVEYLADTPSSLCERAANAPGSTRKPADCQFARFLYVPPVATNVTMEAVGLLPTLDGTSLVRLRDGVRVRNFGGTSAAANVTTRLPIGGTFGSFAAPRIVSATAADPDNSHPAYSDGDTITIRFDQPLVVSYRNWQSGGLSADPNDGRPTAAGVGGPRAFVNALFRFSGKLGQDYTMWSDASTFVVTITDTAATYGIAIGQTVIQALSCPEYTAVMCGDITTAARTSPASEASATLGGSFGVVSAPAIVRFEATDPDEGDLHYSVGDAFVIQFDMATNRGVDGGGRDYIDSLMHLAWPGDEKRFPALPARVGDRLAASWTDASTLEITMETSATPEWPVQLDTRASLIGELASPLLNSPPSRSRATLDLKRPLPRIRAFVASDPDNADAAPSVGDVLTIEYDRRAQPRSPRAVGCESPGRARDRAARRLSTSSSPSPTRSGAPTRAGGPTSGRSGSPSPTPPGAA